MMSSDENEVIILDAGEKGKIVSFDGVLYHVYPCPGNDGHPWDSDKPCIHYAIVGWGFHERR